MDGPCLSWNKEENWLGFYSMGKIKKVLIIVSVMIICIGCDQVTKRIAETTLSTSPPKSYIGNFFRFQFAENSGAFLSLGYNWPEIIRLILLTIIPIIVLSVMLFVLMRSNHFNSVSVFAFALVLGGGFSNMWDRIFNNGLVVDFMNMGIGNIRTGIFNFADIFILIGFGLMVYVGIREHKTRNWKN